MRFALESPAAEIAGRIMQSDKINFFYDQLLVKEPGTHAPTPWHQDQPYWAVSGWQVASLWLPLDPVACDDDSLFPQFVFQPDVGDPIVCSFAPGDTVPAGGIGG